MALSLKPIEIIEKKNYPLLAKAPHWMRVLLRDIADIQNGFAFKSAYFSREKGVPLIRIRDIAKAKTEHLYAGPYDKEFLVSRGDILIGMDGDFTVARWRGSKGLLNQRVCRVILRSSSYNEKFLFVCLQPYLDAINAETSSVTVKHLSSKTVGEIPLPLPPLNEQHRIVAKIEQLFSALDKGVAELKAAKKKLELYRQSLLKAAFEGRLTEKWRREHAGELETAEELLARIKAEREKRYQQQLEEWQQAVKKWEAQGKPGKKPRKPRKPKELPPLTEEELAQLPKLPEGWGWVKVAHLCEVVRGGSPRPAGDPKYYGGNIPFLKVADITGDTNPYLENFTFTIKEAGLTKTRLVTANTLLLSNSGATLGVPKICMFEATFNDGIAAFLGIDENLLLYHYYFWMSNTRKLRSLNQGAAQPNLNTNLIKEYFIPVCSKTEMIAVAEKLHRIFSALDHLTRTIDQALAQADLLRQAILKKAFSGQLVPQDPNDEPASELLKRIKAEREAAKAGLSGQRGRCGRRGPGRRKAQG